MTAILGLYIYEKHAARRIDNIYLEYSTEISEKMPSVKKQFQHFQRNGIIELYEFSDNPSFDDSVVYYYFTNGFDKELQEKFDAEICDKQPIDASICNSVNYYSMLLKKNNLEPSSQYRDFLRSCEAYIESGISENNIAYINSAWKLYCACSAVGVESNKELLYKACRKNTQDEADIASVLSCDIIRTLAYHNMNDAEALLDKTTQEYLKKAIDIDDFIILLGLFPDEMIKSADRKCIEDAFSYCKKSYYYLPLYISFVSFKNAELLGLDSENAVGALYDNRPRNEAGFTSAIAYIIPTHRRLFYYSELCKCLGIDFSKANVYELADLASERPFSAEEYYFQSLLARKYRDISVDIDSIRNVIGKAADVEITETNFYGLYYPVKTALMNNVDCRELSEKMINYDNRENHLIVDILKEELRHLCGGVKSDPKSFDDDILVYDQESEIDVYYHYLLYLKAIGMEPSAEVREKILKAVESYYVENDQGGGYFRNGDFKYIDISMTYECVFLLNMLTK